MSIIVQKYGGSSVASEEKIRLVAGRVMEAKQAGHDVVVVVSAMGSTTSELLGLANNISDKPSVRELDMLLTAGERISMSLLSMAIQRLGQDAISLTGPQAGIHTTGHHFNANIERVEPDRVRRELGDGRVVVVAGYQGISPEEEVTTLGRGGSDTTAVALAAAIDAERCEIYSDVDGVYSADPRVVKAARRIDEISYAEMVELARHGASVLNTRAVQYAWDHDVVLQARSTFNAESPGTSIRDIPQEGEPKVAGVACHKSLMSVVVTEDETAERVLESIGKGDIFLDRYDESRGGRRLLIAAEDIADPEAFAAELREEFGDRVVVEPKRGSVSAVGLGVGRASELKEKAHSAAEMAGIRLYGEVSGEHSLTCIVEPQQVSRTMNLLHGEFIGSDVHEREVA